MRKDLAGPPARQNLAHTERNRLPDQVDSGSGLRRPTVDRSGDLGVAVIARVGAGLDQRGAVHATAFLVPAVIALYRSLGGADRPWVGFGCGVFAAIIPTLFAVLIVHGRLAFPSTV
jgi:hypothetical protein